MKTFADKIAEGEEEAKKEGYASSGGDWFKFQEGDNVFRILEEPVLMFEKFKVGICYTDCGYEGSAKFLTHVLDKKDGEIKVAKLPYKIGTTIASYQTDEDYSFESFPMDYDIKVHAKGAGSKEVEYTVTPRPKREELDSETKEKFAKNKTAQEIVDKMKENKKAEHVADGSFAKEQERKASLKKEIEEAKAGGEPVIEYPSDDISPEDIPF